MSVYKFKPYHGKGNDIDGFVEGLMLDEVQVEATSEDHAKALAIDSLCSRLSLDYNRVRNNFMTLDMYWEEKHPNGGYVYEYVDLGYPEEKKA